MDQDHDIQLKEGSDFFKTRQWFARKGRNAGTIHVSQPYQLTCWTKESSSLGGTMKYGDTSGLLPFRKPTVPGDLNEGFPDNYISKPNDDHAAVELVARALIKAGVSIDGADIVTFRNNLNKIALTVCNRKEAWTIHACMGSRGPMFLDIDPNKHNSQPSFAKQDLFCYYGYKFEQLCTSAPDAGGDPSGAPVDATSEFCAVVRLRIADLRIALAAEMDCYDPGSGAPPSDLRSYVELKTTKPPMNRVQAERLYRQKYPRWWVQSWLAGVSKIVVGERDGQGVLQKIETIKTTHLPNRVESGSSHWDPWVLIRFLNDVLTWMQGSAAANRGQHLTFRFHPEDSCIAMQKDPDGSLPQRVDAVLAQWGAEASAPREGPTVAERR